MFWENVGAGLTANILFVVLTVGIGILVLVIRRRALLRFWGIRKIRKLRVYISHLRIAKGGALDANGTPRSYHGNVVTQLESEMALLLKSLFFATVPGRTVQPGWIQTLLIPSADVEVQPAPGQVQQIDQEGTVVSLGSPGYNVVSGAIETDCNSPVRFIHDNTEIQLPGQLTITNPHQSVVVRLLAGDRYWFYAAGLPEGGTAAAAQILGEVLESSRSAISRLAFVLRRSSASRRRYLPVSKLDIYNISITKTINLRLICNSEIYGKPLPPTYTRAFW